MNMRKLVVLMCVASIGAGAWAIGFIGPPAAELKVDQVSTGYSYTYADMDLDETEDEWVEWGTDGLYDDSGTDKIEIEDVKVQRHCWTIGYGLTDTWELDFMLGGADVKNQARYEGDAEWSGINFDTGFAWGIGTRITLSEKDDVKWGLSAQMNGLNSEIEEDFDDAGTPTKGTLNFEIYDVLVAFGPTVDMGGWKLYGGPFYHLLDGDIDYEEEAGTPEIATYKSSIDLESDGFGGFIGAQFSLDESADLTAEYSATSDGWAASVGIAWKF